MANIIDSIKGRFHRELVANPLTHGWVLNLYRSGERYPQRVCDYFQSEFAPTKELGVLLRQHSADEDKHVLLFSQALKILEQPIIEADLGDVFNEVVRSFTPGTFHILESDLPDVCRRKLANFLAHAHHLEARVAQSFAYHMDACERSGKNTIANLVSHTKTDEDRHVRYTRETVFDLLTRREAQTVMDLHRRAEAKANLRFSQKQVRTFLAQFGDVTPKHRRWLYQICATVMEAAGNYV